MDDIETQKEIQEKSLDEQKPSIPVYDQLPEDQKQKVYKEGEKKFKPQIETRMEKTKT